ncbi:MAG: hypothetical protein HRU24_00100 [Gammaproteobacteria bacterium]|nr:hypothetical protein [Gammaproteobacteria bacterium]
MMIKRLIVILLASMVLIYGVMLLRPAQPTVDPAQRQRMNQPLPQHYIDQLVASPETSEQHDLAFAYPQEFTPPKLQQNKQGELVINYQLRQFFDYYLAGINQESLAQITIRVKQTLQQQLSIEALAQALNIFQNYLQYKNEITAFSQSHITNQQLTFTENIELSQQLIHEIRQSFLSEQVIVAFFSSEDNYNNYALALMKISNNKQLDRQQQLQQIEQLQSTVAPELIEQQQQANQLNNYRQQYIERTQQGATTDELNQFTEQKFGTAAAARLQKLTLVRNHWNDRINRYRNELNTIIELQQDQQTETAMIKHLRKQHFSSQEIKRVKALDAMPKTSN